MGIERIYSIHLNCTGYWASTARPILTDAPGALLPDATGREFTCGRMRAASAIREALSG